RSSLRPHRHERRHWKGRALIDVRRPLVEGDPGDLEREADAEEQYAEQQQGVRGIVRTYALRDVGETCAAGSAVDQRHTVKHERPGEAADQQVLRRRFLRSGVPAGEAASNI